jgi:hypothetical protein
MNSINVLNIEESRQNRLRIGRTFSELCQYIDELYPTVLTPAQKNKVIQATINSESSFTRIEELVLQFYH